MSREDQWRLRGLVSGPTPDHQVWGLVVRKLKGWKAPGHDSICGLWWKKFYQASGFLMGIL